MGMLPSAEGLTRLRATVALTFDRDIIRRRITEVPDGFGGTTQTTAEVTYRGRVSARQVVPDERLQGGRLTAETVYVVHLPWNADVVPADVLVTDDGDTLQVTDAVDIQSTKLHVVVNCYRVT